MLVESNLRERDKEISRPWSRKVPQLSQGNSALDAPIESNPASLERDISINPRPSLGDHGFLGHKLPPSPKLSETQPCISSLK
jgi:hypothetical protein